MNIISVNGLRLTARHGVMEQERRVGNEFEVNLRLVVPMASMAMDDDSLEHTVNYAAVVDVVRREMAIPSLLLEHVVGRIRRGLDAAFPGQISGGSITLSKLAPPIPAQIQSVSFTHQWKNN